MPVAAPATMTIFPGKPRNPTVICLSPSGAYRNLARTGFRLEQRLHDLAQFVESPLSQGL